VKCEYRNMLMLWSCQLLKLFTVFENSVIKTEHF